MLEIARLFLKLGAMGFGGPVATIALMEEETSRRRGWLTADRFSEIYAICKILPGPVAVQMAIYMGYVRRGIRGGIVSGICFIFPAFAIVLFLSRFYASFSGKSGFASVFVLMQAAALAVIIASTWKLAKPYMGKIGAVAVALVSAGIIFKAPRLEPLVIFGFGVIGALSVSGALRRARANAFDPILLQLAWVGFKAGEFVFGTGLAIVPLLEGEVVQKYHWLTHAQFMDGLALGQVTPGPVTITMTFIGYVARGLPGALVATFAIYLPAFINVLLIVPRIWRRMSGSAAAKGFIEWGFPAVIGGIAGTSLRLGAGTLVHAPAWIAFGVSLALGIFTRVPAWVLIPVAGVAGFFA